MTTNNSANKLKPKHKVALVTSLLSVVAAGMPVISNLSHSAPNIIVHGNRTVTSQHGIAIAGDYIVQGNNSINIKSGRDTNFYFSNQSTSTPAPRMLKRGTTTPIIIDGTVFHIPVEDSPKVELERSQFIKQF